MKQILTGSILLVTAHFGWSQIRIQPNITITGADSAFFKNHHFIPNNTPLFPADSAQFKYSVASGKVFISPQDYMPCLKPGNNILYNMPLKRDAGNSYMPNGYRPGNRGLILLKK